MLCFGFWVFSVLHVSFQGLESFGLGITLGKSSVQGRMLSAALPQELFALALPSRKQFI